MLKVVSSGCVATSGLRINPFFQTVRWRKPRWLPIAKSKVFRVPERKPQCPEESVELRRLHNNYHVALRAVRTYLCEEQRKKSSKGNVGIRHAEVEDEEHAACLKINDKWNEEVAKIREQRLMTERAAMKERALNRMISDEERQKKLLEEIEEEVKREKEERFITAENIDQAIEDALASSVDYNFAIDLDANVYRGRNTKPSDVPLDKREKLAIPAGT